MSQPARKTAAAKKTTRHERARLPPAPLPAGTGTAVPGVSEPPPSVPDLLAPPVAPLAAEPVAWGGWIPSCVCRDMHQLEYDGRLYWLGIEITAQLTGEEPAGGPIPVRADLGRRIADLIRADLAAGTATLGPCSPSS
jgi:hypothetical protein